MSSETVFPVTGMTCAGCQNFVQGLLAKQPGVSAAQVNLVMKQAAVTFDPQQTSVERLVQAVRQAGYGAEVPAPKVSALEAQQAFEAEQAKHLRRTTWEAAGAGAAAAVAMFVPLPTVVMALLAVAVMVGAGRHFYMKAWSATKNRTADMNTLVALGTLAAFGLSLFAPEHYFEACIMIIALIRLGQALEGRATRRTSAALSALVHLQPQKARITRAGIEQEVPVGAVRVGDTVHVRPGERLPVDGTLAQGHTTVDESMLTGESMPVNKKAGDALWGGTMNQAGAVTYTASRVGEDSALARIVRLLRDAQTRRAPVQALADAVCAYFVPVVLAIAVVTFVAWLVLSQSPLSTAAMHAIAVLVVACPCAMGLAVPTGMMVATGRAARAGVLFKGGAAVQRLASVDTWVFDKTGTITQGKPDVLRAEFHGNDAARALAIAAALERCSEHPLGAAVVRYAEQQQAPNTQVDNLRADNVQANIGQGITGTVHGAVAHVGSLAALQRQGVDITPWIEAEHKLAAEGLTVLAIAHKNTVLGLLGVADPIKPEAAAVLATFKDQRVALLTGDSEATAQAIAKQAGIREYRATARPDDKVQFVRELQQNQHRVAMVGDGINDAPALVQADVGIAMGSGADIALEAGDVVIMRSDLKALQTAIHVAKRAMRIVHGNLFWAFAFNTACIPLAAGALLPWTSLQLTPVLASAAMATSSIVVVLNSLRR